MSKERETSKQYRPVQLKRDHARPRGQPQVGDEEVACRLSELFRPAAYGLTNYYRSLGLRWRILNLPVMVAALLSLIWRQVPSVNVLVQMLVREQLLWSAPVRVSQQALDQRLRCLPAKLFGEVFRQVLPELLRRATERTRPTAAVIRRALTHFRGIWIVDATTLEELFKKVGALRGQQGVVLAGKLATVLDLVSKLPRQLWLDSDPACNEKSFLDRVKASLESGILLLIDRGFYSFPFFDHLTDATVSFITRARSDAAFEIKAVLRASENVRDYIIIMGLYRSNPCKHPLRLVQVRIGGVWHRYLTNVLDPTVLPVADVCDLYARRWRIEEAFCLTKRLLNLSYLWTGANNGVEMQVWTTWMFYAVLVDLSDQVAQILNQPLDNISQEMVYRGLYHFTVARRQGLASDPAAYLAAQDDLGIVKKRRPKRELARLDKLPADLNL